MPFTPSPQEPLQIGTARYRVAAHPAVPDMPYGQTGRKATVYALDGEDGPRRALKVFAQAFRTPRTDSQGRQLRPFAALPGLQVCARVTLTPERHAPLLQQLPDLRYAVLMPWVEGVTWQELMLEQTPLRAEVGLALARDLARTLAALEERGAAHCDLSGANVLVRPATPGLALVDLEELFAPGLPPPQRLPAGSPGYAHRSAAGGIWGAEADRFAGAVLLAEMVAWHVPAIRARAAGESFFDPPELQRDTSRARLLADVLRRHAPAGVAELFGRAWAAIDLAACPSLAEWADALGATRAVSPARTLAAAEPPRPASPAQELSLAEADRQVQGYAEAYQIAPALAAISYGRALLRRGLLREQRGDLRGGLDDFQAALGVAPAGELADELRAAAARVAPQVAVAPVLAQPPAARPTPGGGGHPAQPPAPPLEVVPWPGHLRAGTREGSLRAIVVATALLGVLASATGVGLERPLHLLSLALFASAGLAAQEALAGGLLGGLCGALYAYGLRTRLNAGQRAAAASLGALGAALAGWLGASLVMRSLAPALWVGALEGAAAGALVGVWLDARLGDTGGRWARRGLLGWAAAWSTGLWVTQLLSPGVGPVIGAAVGWSLALLGCGLLLVQTLARRPELEV